MQSSRKFSNPANVSSTDAEEFKLNYLQSQESVSQGNLISTSSVCGASLMNVISVDFKIPNKKTLKKY
jgi:hypothetical protein